MYRFLKKKRLNGSLSPSYFKGEIDPDEVLIDAKNLPAFDTERLEGKFERPIGKATLISFGASFLILLFIFAGRAWALQVNEGQAYKELSENNRLRETVIIAERGVITDKNGKLLAWNTPGEKADYPSRSYISKGGFSILLGYVTYPLKDSDGFYYQPYFKGMDGIESAFDLKLKGTNGLKITETNAVGDIESESVLEKPENGETLVLSIDERIQEVLFSNIKELAERVGFTGGSAAMMDVETGEIIALTSYPEYDSQVLTDGADSELIKSYSTSAKKPYLDRAISGLYAPGSIIKPFVALGALSENVIAPEKEILSTGSISIPNPYDKTKESVFRDWKAHGWVDMRRAIAVSSDVYFYEIGGGFKDQVGLGIANIEKYMRLFGFATATGIDVGEEGVGTLPNPAWKEEVFDGDPWRVGDTYNTAIGQYGMQVTPIQALRATAAIGNGGRLLKPSILKRGGAIQEGERLPIAAEDFTIVKEGMRLAVREGTAVSLNIAASAVAGKTGTAELGFTKQTVNSWVIGFFPYEKPRYAFVVQMEKGPVKNLVGAPYVMRQVLDYMALNTPEYFEK